MFFDYERYPPYEAVYLTKCDSDFDKLRGLAIGGDDYMTKPFKPLEVVARIQANLRRQRYTHLTHGPIEQTQAIFEYHSFTLDPGRARLVIDNMPVACTAKEFELLHYFCKHPHRILTSAQLYEAVWGSPGFGEEKTVTMHISKIRKKLGDDAKKPTIILNLRGIGYKFVPESPPFGIVFTELSVTLLSCASLFAFYFARPIWLVQKLIKQLRHRQYNVQPITKEFLLRREK
ncbi:response regulator transcription factor [Paenibacillus sp. MZ04-78.2]|uniref:response regulator transcription factor n=1 Tax=Paenibacillus sp. MZ04-78.2 TaxID=2962034 RepID=UPI0020B8D3F4|nr:response regulator transcription factor [Paenibacillus sp. MZ04-78.2]MCP3773531.1 response regulator transcription factor [Paenibacillus sp. MZ04-78.2]